MRYYYIANSDHSDQIYGNQEPICIDLAEVKRLAKEMVKKFPEGHIAVIEEGDDPICVGEIRE